MSLDSLVPLLESFARYFRPEGNRDERIGAYRSIRHDLLPRDYHLMLESLNEALRKIPELEIFDNYLRGLMGGWSHLDYDWLAITLKEQVLEVGASQTIADLQRYLDSDTFIFRQILFLGGVVVPGPIPLTNGITLIPFTGSDQSSIEFIPPGLHGPPHWIDTGARNQITAALFKDFAHPKQHVEGPNPTIKPVGSQDLGGFGDLEDALLCLSVPGPSGPAKIASSIFPVDWIPCWGGPVGELPQHAQLTAPKSLNESEVDQFRHLHHQFLELPDAQKKRFRVPLTRLSLAIRRHWNVDMAIDLGIALEVLLVKKTYDSSIGLTLRLHAARLLGNTVEERKDLANLMKSLYDLRSNAAHSGELPAAIRGVNSSIILKRSAEVTAKAIEHVIMNGEPDWDSIIYS